MIHHHNPMTPYHPITYGHSFLNLFFFYFRQRGVELLIEEIITGVSL